MIYVYAIGDENAAAAPGLDVIREGALTAFVADSGAREPDPDALISHNRVVAGLMEQRTVLPMRFGTVVDGESPLRALLSERGEELTRALARVHGRVELGVRALWRGPRTGGRPATGREFMTAKLERRLAARRASEEIHNPLCELAAESVCRLTPDDDAAFAAAYLVARGDVGHFERRVDRLRLERTDVDLVASGPWPPYSFSEARDG